jgi:peroxiredoxin
MLDDLRRRMPAAGWWWGASLLSAALVVGGCSKSNSPEGGPARKFEVAEEEAPRGAAVAKSNSALPAPHLNLPPPAGDRTSAAADTVPGTESVPTVPSAPPRQDMAATADTPPVTRDGATAAATKGTPAVANPLRQPPSIAGNQLDTSAAAQGTPEQLAERVSQLRDRAALIGQQVKQGSAAPAALQPVYEALMDTSTKLLAATDAKVALRKTAVDAKMEALLTLMQLTNDRKWGDEFQKFAKALAADKAPEIAIEGRAFMLAIRAGEVLQGKGQDADGLLAEIKALVADEHRNNSVLTAAQQACEVLGRIGREEDARVAFELVANAFKDNPDPQLAEEANNIFEQLAVFDLKVNRKLADITAKRDGAVAEFTDAVTQLLQRPNPGVIALQNAVRSLPPLEQSGNYDVARKVCALIDAAYKNASPEIRQAAQQSTEMTLRRLDLVGKPLIVEGTLLDGSPFDFGPYRGKVVLVAFWASMSPACRKELLDVKAAYEKYHAQGFEVIGVCLDEDTATTNKFLAQTQLPWTTILNTKMAEQFGIPMIPYLMLTDQQGNVTDLFVVASALDARLASMLGGAPAAARPAAPPAAGQ